MSRVFFFVACCIFVVVFFSPERLKICRHVQEALSSLNPPLLHSSPTTPRPPAHARTRLIACGFVHPGPRLQITSNAVGVESVRFFFVLCLWLFFVCSSFVWRSDHIVDESLPPAVVCHLKHSSFTLEISRSRHAVVLCRRISVHGNNFLFGFLSLRVLESFSSFRFNDGWHFPHPTLFCFLSHQRRARFSLGTSSLCWYPC